MGRSRPCYGFERREVDENQTGKSDRHVQRHGHVCRDRRIVNAQQIKAREQAADDGAADVAAVEKSEPRNTSRCHLNPSCDRGQRRAHEERRRQQTHSGSHAA